MKFVLAILFVMSLFLFAMNYGKYQYFPDMHYSPAVDSQEFDEIGSRNGNRKVPADSIPYKIHEKQFGVLPYPFKNTVQDLKRSGAMNRSPINTNELEVAIKKGKEKFNIYCAPCHGLDGGKNNNGKGSGPVAAYWLAIPSLYGAGRYLPELKREQYPLGSLYHIITEGIGSMKSYSSQVSSRDRWAIAHYVKFIQQSRR